MNLERGILRKVRVNLVPETRSYDVLIGRGILTIEKLTSDIEEGVVAIITDQNVGTKILAGEFEERFRQERLKIELKRIAPGELSKSLESLSDVLEFLAEKKLSRNSTIIALGGGVIGDLVGFAAAIYKRGINFIHAPTTLLAMVDSSVGGKTGINLSAEGKNLVGAFYQPKLVVADLDTLKTLPDREFKAGMAEVIKYGAIADKALFDSVAKGVSPKDSNLADIIARCVEIKARIVEQDEFETKGLRALLNFGHTIGHAIEKAGNYEIYRHGEAIALGMRAAAWLSVWQTGLPESDAFLIENALVANGLDPQLDSPSKPNLEIDEKVILAALDNDKKVAADGKNRWVLLKALGEAISDCQISTDRVTQAVDKLYKPIGS